MSTGALFSAWPHSVFHPRHDQVNFDSTTPFRFASFWDENVMSTPRQDESANKVKSTETSPGQSLSKATNSASFSSNTFSPHTPFTPFKPLESPRQALATKPNPGAVHFQYESRARSSSPATRLQNHAVTNREAKKKQFLNRLRNRHDDAQFDRNGDQLMRIDWMRERKAWEKEMAKKGSEIDDLSGQYFPYEEMDEVDIEQAPQQEHEQEQPPEEEMLPIEEQEFETLAGSFDHMDEDQYSNPEDDYDAVFMQFLTQDRGGNLTQNPSDVMPRQSDGDVEMF